jgi:ABC-type phosphate/phosphonate transport system substrate-binding protein
VIAALGMYDRAEVQPANDRFWALIRDGLLARGITAPDQLTQGELAYMKGWLRPDLVLAQTCGFPYRAKLHGHVTLIGTPDYGVPGCPPGHYRSIFLARAKDARPITGFDGTPIAYNEALSQSGWAAPQTHAAKLGLHLPAGLCTGGHVVSARAVAEGKADLAALDIVTWEMIRDHDPALTAALREVALTDPTPGLPLIAALGADAEATFAAVVEAIAALPSADAAALHLKGLIHIPATAYLAIPTPAAPPSS